MDDIKKTVTNLNVVKSEKKEFNWRDPLDLDGQLSEEEKLIRDTAYDYAQGSLLPRVEEAFLEENTDVKIFKEMGELGLLGVTISEKYGCAGASYVSYGLVAREIERIDSGYRSMMSVQSSLVMHPINAFGSEEQKQKFLPKLASGDFIGCFGLTEPDAGSDPGGMKTTAKKVDGGYELSGSKMWISNSPIADVFIVWAKSDKHENKIKGFILEKSMKGLSAPKINKKLSLRASITGEIVMDKVFVPEENMLPNVEGLKGPLSCLTQARFGISWGMVGAATDCYQVALNYAKERKQFSKPIAAYQLTQSKLANMLTRITEGQLMAYQLAKLKDDERMNFLQVSMAKRNNCMIARDAAKTAREILGGNGITIDYSPIRHMANIESVFTYEGTHEMHTLILGEDITKISAFDN